MLFPKSWKVEAGQLSSIVTPKRTRPYYTAGFKAEAALAVLNEYQPLADLAARYQLATA